MDPLSIAGSIAGLVTLADAVYRGIAKYRKAVKNSDRDAKELMDEVKNTSLLLHSLSLLASDLEASDLEASADEPAADEPAAARGNALRGAVFQMQHLHHCQKLLRGLQKDLPQAAHGISSTSSVRRLQARLKWPFSSTQIKDAIEELRRHQQLFTTALAADSVSQIRKTLSYQKEILSNQNETLDGLRGLQDTVEEILDIQTRVLLNQASEKLFKFFLKTNPQSEFEMSKKLRHPMTGLWLTEGDEFREWFESPNSRIWLSGIPGSGKTVLAGALITKCLHLMGSDPRSALAYYFCTYRDPKTLTPTAILSALAVQLARQNEDAFHVLQKYHEELRTAFPLPKDPAADGLIVVLSQMIGFFDQAYLIVDGLDECGDYVEASVQALRSIGRSRDGGNESFIVNIALLSRDEVNIRERLEGLYHWVEIEAHTEDLELYVAAELTERIGSRRLRIRDMGLRDHILTTLVNGAKGM